MATIQAQDVVNAVIQDSQNLTTNRAALYDYTDRIHQRILRESKWRFLLSDPQTFVTIPGVSSYTLSGTAPAGSFTTSLNLSNFANIAPGTVFDVTSWRKLEEDPEEVTTLNSIINRDGSLRTGPPRTYSNSISNPGTISLKPAPDAQNQYYPVPETPVVTYQALSGCVLPLRTYFGVVTYVDAFGGEGVQCTVPFTITIPAGNVLVVESPNPVPGGGIAGNQTQYSSWNLYVGTSVQAYYIQNVSPLGIGSSWTENTYGIFQGQYPIPSLIGTPTSSTISITSGGMLQATTQPTNVVEFPWALIDSSGNWWEVTAGSGSSLTTTSIAKQTGVKTFSTLYLWDTTFTYVWGITVSTTGQLASTQYQLAPVVSAVYIMPPLTPSIQPLNAYVIQFRYYQTRAQITSSNPTQVLQIPYAYKDIVIAGVNYLACMYRDRLESREPSAQTLIWKKDFDEGMAQIRRDLRVNYRKVDFIAPDPMTQYVVGNQQGIPTMGW